MNKTVSVNIGGLAFKLDENAFQKIKRYLEAIKARFSHGKEQEEILSDIETRIAEIFTEKLKEKDVVNIDDVDYVIGIMGQPHDIGEASEDQTSDETFETSDSTTDEESKESKKSKRLFRNSDDMVLGGVASGMSAYFGIKDPIWLRLVFVILTIAGVGAMIPIYLLLWIVIPKAKTRTDKLQMRGEEANLANIEKAFKKGIENLEDSIKDLGAKKKVGQLGSFIRTIIGGVLSLVVVVLKFVSKFLGVIIVIVGSIAFVALTIALIMNKAIIHPGVPELAELTIASGPQSFIFFLGVFLIAGIPLLALLYIGIRIVLGRSARVRYLGAGMFGLWIIGIIMTSIIGIAAASDFSETASVDDDMKVFLSDTDTLNVKGIKFRDTDLFETVSKSEKKLKFKKFHTAKDALYYENVSLVIKNSSDDDFQLTVKKRSMGKDNDDARDKARRIKYEFDQSNSDLNLNNFIQFTREDKFRDQKVYLTLWVPKGKTVNIDDSLRSMLMSLNKSSDHKQYTAYNNYWTNLGESFACASCDSVDVLKHMAYTDSNTDENDDSDFEGLPIRQMEFSDFENLDISGLFDVEIEHGEYYKFEMQGREEDMDEIEVQKEGNTLNIDAERKLKWMKKKVRIAIQMPELSKVDFSGACDASITGFNQEEMEVETAGAAEIDIDVNVNELKLDLAGAAEVDLSGEGEFLYIDIAGATELNALDFNAKEVEVDIAGASEVSVSASESIKGDLAGACSFKYRGDPSISISKIGFSSVKKID